MQLTEQQYYKITFWMHLGDGKYDDTEETIFCGKDPDAIEEAKRLGHKRGNVTDYQIKCGRRTVLRQQPFPRKG